MMIAALEYKARVAARKATLGVAATLLLSVGVGFLTAAGWMALLLVTDALTTALIIGGAYFGVGLIFLAFAMRTPRAKVNDAYVGAAMETPPATKNGTEAIAGIGAAFLQGLDAGHAARSGFDRGRTH